MTISIAGFRAINNIYSQTSSEEGVSASEGISVTFRLNSRLKLYLIFRSRLAIYRYEDIPV